MYTFDTVWVPVICAWSINNSANDTDLAKHTLYYHVFFLKNRYIRPHVGVYMIKYDYICTYAYHTRTLIATTDSSPGKE